MLKILTVLFCFFVVNRSDYPGRFKYEEVATRFQHRHIHNMTENILKDALYKIRHADVIQSQYKDAYGYELGLIASGIMDHYRHMIHVYRFYSKPEDFKNHTDEVRKIMNAYAIMQSDYNEMMHETVLFYKTLDSHLRQQRADRRRAKILARKYEMQEELILEMIKAGYDAEEILSGGKKNAVAGQLRIMKEPGDVNDILIDLKNIYLPLTRNSMNDKSFSSTMSSIVTEIGMEGFDFPKEKSNNDWVKKNAQNTKEAEYKKNLRYKMWADKWGGFNPDIEGVNIPDKIARMGLKNDSDFIMSELKGDFN